MSKPNIVVNKTIITKQNIVPNQTIYVYIAICCIAMKKNYSSPSE